MTLAAPEAKEAVDVLHCPWLPFLFRKDIGTRNREECPDTDANGSIDLSLSIGGRFCEGSCGEKRSNRVRALEDTFRTAKRISRPRV